MLLRTLGGLALEGAHLRRPKPLLLLAYLALEGPTERRYLAELFWMNAANPRRSLTTALSQIRKASPNLVHSDEVRVWTTLECDAHALNHANRDSLIEAFSAYRGPFLEGLDLSDTTLELEEWIYRTREVLGGRARQALLMLAQREAALGAFEKAALRAEQAFSLAGASEPDGDVLASIHTFLLAGPHPLTRDVADEARAFGEVLAESTEQARESLRSEFDRNEVAATLRNFPSVATSFIGREREIGALSELLSQSGTRLLTITGVGGSGKTRLAIELVQRHRHQSFERACFVPLENLSDPHRLLPEVVSALEVPPRPNLQPITNLRQAIGEERLLLVLDNFEHLLAAAHAVSELLRTCPNLNLVVTSRERLGLPEEWVFPISGLSLLDDSGDGSGERPEPEAVRLFLERAAQANARLKPGAEMQQGAVDVCHLIDGNPLAIELAAAWTHILSPSRIAGEIERGLDLLQNRNRSSSDRHQSIRATFEHSWDLLNPAERELLCKLPVFKGGFTLEAALEVAETTPALLASLVDKSLIKVHLGGSLTERYELHPLLRAYTREKISVEPEQEGAVDERHSQYYLGLLLASADLLWGEEQTIAASRLGLEFENLRKAWSRAAAFGEMLDLRRAVEALWALTEFRGSYEEGSELLAGARQALQSREGAQEDVAYLKGVQGWFLMRLGRLAESGKLAEEALQVARTSGDGLTLIAALNTLGACTSLRGDLTTARRIFQEFHEAIEEQGIARYLVPALSNLAEVEASLGLYAEAEGRYRQAIIRGRELQNHRLVSEVLEKLAVLLVWQNRAQEALPLALEALALARVHDPEMPDALLTASNTYLLLDHVGEAEKLCREALTICESNSMPPGDALTLLGRITAVQGEAEEAQELLQDAIRAAFEADENSGLLAAATYLAELWISQDRREHARHLLCIVQTHPATTHHIRNRAHQLLETLPAPADEVSSARLEVADLVHLIAPMEQ